MIARDAGSREGSALERWLDRFGITASFSWGVAEATLFFFVPDVMVGLVALFRPRKAVWAALAAIGGALIGGGAMYWMGRAVGRDLLTVVEAVPGIPLEMVARVHGDLLEHGGLAMTLAPLQGIPYKIYAAEWGILGWGLPSMLGWTIVARAARILPFALVVGGVGILLHGHVRAHPRFWLALSLGGWTAVYVAYFSVHGF